MLSIRSVLTCPLSVPQPAPSGRAGFVNSLVVEIVTADGRTRLPAYASFIGWIDDRQAVTEAEPAMRLGLKQLTVKDILPITYSG